MQILHIWICFFFILLSDAFKTHFYHHNRILIAQVEAELNRIYVVVVVFCSRLYHVIRAREFNMNPDTYLGVPKVIHQFLVNDSMIQVFGIFRKQQMKNA